MAQRKMWDQKEDSMIMEIVAENDTKPEDKKWKWSQIAQILQDRIPGCRRSGKQCRERWFNHLNPVIKKDRELSEEEVHKLFDLQNQMGNHWAIIARQFEGRTDNNLKNFFYSSLRRAIRQVNSFVAQHKKKSNIKPFKQSIITKILNISDQKHREKLDIKSDKADYLAQSVKKMLTQISQEDQEKELSHSDIDFREKIVKAIQEFNKNCKKKKSKKTSESEEPDIDQLSQYNNMHMDNESQQSQKQKKKKKKSEKPTNIKKHKMAQKQVYKLKEQPKQLFQKPEADNEIQKNKKIKAKMQIPIEQLIGNEQIQPKLENTQSKKQTNRYSNSFKPDVCDFLKQSVSIGEVPRMLTRQSSNGEFNRNFINNLQNWRKESKTDNSLFGADHLHLIDPMLESLNIGETIGKFGEGSLVESGLFKMMKGDSKIEN